MTKTPQKLLLPLKMLKSDKKIIIFLSFSSSSQIFQSFFELKLDRIQCFNLTKFEFLIRKTEIQAKNLSELR